MQKYLHLLQIVETEKTVAKQLRQQIEDGEIEIERLKSEVTSPRPDRPDRAGSLQPRGCPGDTILSLPLARRQDATEPPWPWVRLYARAAGCNPALPARAPAREG